MKLGFIGAGTISSAIVEGLNTSPARCPIVLSPRNAEISAQLAGRHNNVTIAASNQAVLDAADTVVVAVRPQVAHEVLTSLSFRPDHQIISLVPAVSLEYLRSVTTPSRSVTRAVPLPAAAYRQSPTVIYPSTPSVKALFDQLGTAIELEKEEEFEIFTSATSIMSSYFGFAATTTSWMEHQGASKEQARVFVGQMLRGLAAATAAMHDRSFSELALEHETRGGLNEQVFRAIAPTSEFVELTKALNGILMRLEAGKTQKSRD
jgi:pyrroline-5-carboxylate reductase